MDVLVKNERINIKMDLNKNECNNIKMDALV